MKGVIGADRPLSVDKSGGPQPKADAAARRLARATDGVGRDPPAYRKPMTRAPRFDTGRDVPLIAEDTRRPRDIRVHRDHHSSRAGAAIRAERDPAAALAPQVEPD